jgi:mycothiol system anti-sigma-R factor
MSCGKPHEVPCSEVLDRVYNYLDGEMDDAAYVKVKVHLDECGPCLREFGLEEAVKRLVHRHCGHEPVPADLRQKVLTRIEAVRVQIETRIQP